ncbi:MAG TPA: TonB family protein [Terriglobia bacterium]|nr:TonB family protein [Terriglobia bacterium]
MGHSAAMRFYGLYDCAATSQSQIFDLRQPRPLVSAPARPNTARKLTLCYSIPHPEVRTRVMKNCPTCHANYPRDYTHCPRDLTLLKELGLWQEGAVVRGRYRILARVGAGGMATVYKAEHIHFHELRALKAINPDLAADANFVQRFTQEAVLTRRLQHPNAVRVDDIDQAEDGLPFIVMEFIGGRSLKEVMQSEGPMPVARVCSTVKQVASALAAAHELGIVHRDIKPANVALVAPGSSHGPAGVWGLGKPHGRNVDLVPQEQAKVLDFGIAKIKEGHLEDSGVTHGTLTGTGMLIGTPAYMSPEQAVGKKGDDLDGRSDLYSLGVMMYQMLAGELPLKGDSEMGMLIAHIQSVPRDIRTHRADVPEAIAKLVMQCLEKPPDRRPANAGALIYEIELWERQPGPLGAAEPEARGAERVPHAPVEKEWLEQKQQIAEARVASTLRPEREARAREGVGATVLGRSSETSRSTGPLTQGVEIPSGTTEPAPGGSSPSLRAKRVSSGTPVRWKVPAAIAGVLAGAVLALYLGLRSPGASDGKNPGMRTQGSPASGQGVSPSSSEASQAGERPTPGSGTASVGSGASSPSSKSATPHPLAGGAIAGAPAARQQAGPGASTQADQSSQPLTSGAVSGETSGAPPPHPKPATPKHIRISGQIATRNILYGPAPAYPQIAAGARVEGLVRLAATLNEDGTIQDLKLISGPPLLVKAAMDAVSTWRYRPTVRNGVPVQVETEVDVKFTLK